jgi:hypothetical protein
MAHGLFRSSRSLIVACGVLLLLSMTASLRSQSPRAGSSPAAFLQPGNCYAFTFSIPGVPNWKVMEVLDSGWIRAEVEAGTSTAQRETTWINTTQIVTARVARCSA